VFCEICPEYLSGLPSRFSGATQGEREGEKERERRRTEGEVREKGKDRNWLREEKYSLEQRVPRNCILRSGLCMCSQD